MTLGRVRGIVAFAIVIAACSRPSAQIAAPSVREGDGGISDGAMGDAASATNEPPLGPRSEGMSWTRDRRRATPNEASDTCEVADSNLAKAESAVLAARLPAADPTRKAWDHVSPPLRLDAIVKRFGVGADEERRIKQNGFVVPARLEYDSYADAFHDVYQAQLPVYVSIDAVLHAVYASNDGLMADLERGTIVPLLGRTLDALSAVLPAARAVYPQDVADDVDLYVTVARALLADADVPNSRGAIDPASSALVAQAHGANALKEVALFGRTRMIDFSQYAPRGHYAKVEEGKTSLAPYFRAAMWLSRLELNLVSRSSRSSAPGFTPDPRETPREELIALALSDLAQKARVMDELATLDRAWGLLAGKREDVSLADLAALRVQAGITTLTDADAPAKLRATIGSRFQRTARFHYMPQGSTDLPAITTTLGPRVTLDSAATRPLVHGELPGRYDLSAGDVAYFIGENRGKRYLAADVARFPSLPAKLDDARAIAHGAVGADDLYSAWFDAVRGLALRSEGALPSFMETDAFADLRMNSTIVAYGQLRHNYVLMAGQPYDEGGCEIPDGYVEPAIATYDALIAYAERGRRAFASIDPKDETKAAQYFESLTRTLRVLRAIGAAELTNAPLSADAQRFLAMVTEIVPASTEQPPSWTGWYFDMFRGREDEALRDPSFVADYYTSSNSGNVAYAGATAPRLGIFVVDTGGAPRAFVGPVARAFEAHGSLSKRFTDADVPKLGAAIRDPWATSYTVAAPPVPPLTIRNDPSPDTSSGPSTDGAALFFVAQSTRALGPVTLEVLDHHGVKIGGQTKSVGTQPTSRSRFRWMTEANRSVPKRSTSAPERFTRGFTLRSWASSTSTSDTAR